MLLCQHVMPWLSATYPEENYVFQQDGAPVNTANSMQRSLENNMAVQWSQAVWLPYFPDRNLLNYGCVLPLRRVYDIKCMYLAPRTHGLFIT